MVVRIVSKSFGRGEYYCKKVRLIEVHNERNIVARLLESGKILYDVEQRMLETVMPPNGSRVLIVGGDFRGSIGVLVSRDSKKQTAQIHLEDDPSSLLSFPFDDVTQFDPNE